MMTVATINPNLSTIKARRQATWAAQHERFTLTRKGKPEAVLLSVDDLEGLETTLEVLADATSVAAIAESLAERASGAPVTDIDTFREELRQRPSAPVDRAALWGGLPRSCSSRIG
jgi:antitoxin YefM